MYKRCKRCTIYFSIYSGVARCAPSTCTHAIGRSSPASAPAHPTLLPRAQGIYQVKFLLDGSEWRLAPGWPEDEAGMNNVLVVD